MGKKDRLNITVFANSIKDVRYRMKRARDYKDYVIKKVKKVGKDNIGNNKYSLTLHLRRNKR